MIYYTIYGFKYFIKGKIFGFCKNTENVKGLKQKSMNHPDEPSNVSTNIHISFFGVFKSVLILLERF